jgi:endoglucanase Acf2
MIFLAQRCFLALVVMVLATLSAAAEVVSVGSGGYLTTIAPGKDTLPATIYRTDRLTGPMVTNQWWSSLVFLPYSQPMFAHPLAVKASESGLLVSHPGAGIVASHVAIIGRGVSKTGDFAIGHSNIPSFPDARCDSYSDWAVTAAFSTPAGSLKTTFAHGSPFVYGMIEGGSPTITFGKPPKIWSGTAKDSTLGITIDGSHYALFGPTGSTWDGLDTLRWTNQSGGKPYFSVALLPDNTPATLALFQKYAHNHLNQTRLDWNVTGATAHATYTLTTTDHEPGTPGTLFALYPHQWKYTSAPLTDLSYTTVRGQMKLAAGSSFATQVPVQGLLPHLPSAGIPDRPRLIAYLQAEADAIAAHHAKVKASNKPEDFADTYWGGKQLGRYATLSGVAEAAEAPELQQIFLNEIKRRLENWFTATPGKTKPVFYYNSTWGTLIGHTPSYGSDRLNDHHFHYGYFIRAAAEVARHDPAWAKNWGPMVELLIRDIASGDRNDKMFPHLRCFDIYAGHSWASGDANFADGNNQESSSESMNAWYGMLLWGQATGNTAIRDLGLFLFNTERTAVEEYWFDVADTNFPKEFPNVALGMVWGGKGSFETWFSPDIDHIHGINWLPFTPASVYMGRHPDYVAKNHARIVEKRPGGTDFNTGWGDLVVMFSALTNPAAAASYIDQHPSCKLESGNTHAFMYHWIHTLNSLGTIDASVTADYPFYNVLTKDGKKTYVVYNFGTTPLTVKFSDGHELTSPPQSMAKTSPR